MTKRRSLARQREASNRKTTAEDFTTTALSRTHGALRLLGYVRGSAEHRRAVLSSVLRRLFDAAAAIEQEIRKLAA
jgi:hypothetical protein